MGSGTGASVGSGAGASVGTVGVTRARLGTRVGVETCVGVGDEVGTLMLGRHTQTLTQAKKLSLGAIKDRSGGAANVLVLPDGMLIVTRQSSGTDYSSHGACRALQLLPPLIEVAQLADEQGAIGALHLLLAAAAAMR